MHKIVLIFVMVSAIFVGCETIKHAGGCFGYWVDDGGLKRGTIAGKNADYSKPYRQCVEKEAPHKNTEKIPYG